MRKHDVRKWLHAILDLLPVILIPVFMIYSHRHTIDSGLIQFPQNKVVDFNQINNNVFKTFENYETDGIFVNSDGYFISFYGTPTANIDLNIIQNGSINLVANNIYYVKTYYTSTTRVYCDFTYLKPDNTNGYYYGVSGNNLFQPQYDCSLVWSYFFTTSTSLINVNTSLQIFNFTQMFGSGNEPTIEQFNQWYSEDYYDYTLSHKELLKNTSTITYSDTDIMSQFTYQLYNSVDKYFNVGNVFHLGEVYDWFNLNIFNGNAPIYIYVVYQIVLYELIMDLLFLLYALFMWFIDMIEKLMEKPLNSVR